MLLAPRPLLLLAELPLAELPPNALLLRDAPLRDTSRLPTLSALAERVPLPERLPRLSAPEDPDRLPRLD